MKQTKKEYTWVHGESKAPSERGIEKLAYTPDMLDMLNNMASKINEIIEVINTLKP